MNKPTIFLADDHQIVVDGLTKLIQELDAFTIVGSANNGLVAWTQIQILQPEIVLLDLEMPGMHGMVLAGEIKEAMPNVKIVILSLHNETSIIKQMIDIGVDGYLLKNADKKELQFALGNIANGKRHFSSDLTVSLHNQNAVAPRKNHESNDSQVLESLTAREKEILALICEGLTNKEIAQKLHISTRTTDAHRANLLRKIDVKNVVGLVKFAMRTGISH